MSEGLELCRQDHVDEYQGERKREGEVAERAAHLLVFPADVDAHVERRRKRRQSVVHRGDGAVEAAGDHVRVDGDHASLVLAVDLRRSHGLAHADQLPQGHAAYLQRVERPGGKAQRVGQPHHHVDLAVEVDELGGPVAAHGALDLLGDEARIHVVPRGHVTQDLDLHLRLTAAGADPHIADLRQRGQLFANALGVGVALLEVLAADAHRDVGVGAAQYRAEGGRLPGLEGERPRWEAGLDLAHPLQHAVGGDPRVEAHFEGARVRARGFLALHVGADILSHAGEDGLDAGIVL